MSRNKGQLRMWETEDLPLFSGAALICREQAPVDAEPAEPAPFICAGLHDCHHSGDCTHCVAMRTWEES